MIVSMFGASLSYNIDDETTRLVVVVVFMFMFVFFYSWGQGPGTLFSSRETKGISADECGD